MADRKIFTVNAAHGLNLREAPSKEARVLRILADGEKITADNNIASPDGWLAVKGGGFVMTEFIK